jgi:hypothetical protein
MPGCVDPRLSIMLVCDCNANPVATTALHEMTIDNHTGQTLYDVTFAASIVSWSAGSFLNLGTAGVATLRGGSLSRSNSLQRSFTLNANGRGTETVATTVDWILSPNAPLTGMQPQRVSVPRSCRYDVDAQ